MAYLVDDEKSDIAAKKRVAEVASHEVSHQWYVILFVSFQCLDIV
jgi:hypothetical protein